MLQLGQTSIGGCVTKAGRLRQKQSESVNTTMQPIALFDEAECQALESFLVERLYEFNSHTTGYFDGKLIGGAVLGTKGEIIAGYCGHTWGGNCELTNVWVSEGCRGKGLGKALLESAEAQAMLRQCSQIVLRTHSFQAPGFYEANGYKCRFVLENVPAGYSDMVYIKVLRADSVHSASQK